ncbi:MAG: DNA-directed DNA polymerase [Methanocellales archaeon]|nr:DNA-directed DNA polymerase [Methanocellales archaeon]
MAQMRGWLIDADYVTKNGKAVVRLWCKDDAGRDVVILDPNFEPYFYAIGKRSTDDIMDVRATRYDETIQPKKVEKVKKKDFGTEIEVFKITVAHPQHVPSLREAIGNLGLDVREADIPFAVRYIIDRELSPLDGIVAEGESIDVDYAEAGFEAREIRYQKRDENPELHLMAFDCEMMNPRGVPNPERDPIIIISIAPSKGDVKLLTMEKDDASLLGEFVKFVKDFDPDVICGYNSDNFDWPYLLHRAKVHDIRLNIGRDGTAPRLQQGALNKVSVVGRPNVDLYRVVGRDLGDIKIKTLEDVAEFLDVMKKSERTNIPAAEIYKYWDDPEKRKTLLEYAKDDVMSTLGIAKKLLPLQYEFARMTRQPLDEVSKMGRGRQVESLLCAEAHKIGELVPSKGREAGETYVGGFVLEPKKGIHENVACLDFSSMYPSIMISFNISPDTVTDEDGYEAPEVGYRFRKKPDGFFKRILQELVSKRSALKRELETLRKNTHEYQLLDIRQQAIKILTNAFYGYTGWTPARWYRRECAEATAAWGRHFIKQAIKRAEEMGLEVIYGDTDSLFVKTGDDQLMKKAKELADVMSKELPLELDIERVYDVIFFTEKKKRYAGLTSDGELIIKGLEVRRGDWCALAKEIQADVVRTILQERNPSKAVQLVQDTVSRVREGKIPLEKLVIHKTLTKKISSYESMQAHVRAAKRAKVPIEVGAKIAYVIVKGLGSIGDRAYPINMFSRYENGYLFGDDKRYEIDADYYINNQIVPATSRILHYFGYSDAELKGKPKQATFDLY